MKKLIAILLVLLVICGYAFAEGTISEPREFTVKEQAFDAYLDIAFVYDEGVKYLEEMGIIWERIMDTDSDVDISQAWFDAYLIGDGSDSAFKRFSSLNELAIGKYGYESAEKLASHLMDSMKGRSNKVDAVWICLSILQEAGYIEGTDALKIHLDKAMEGIRTVMAEDKEYPFMKELQNYYKEANYLYEYLSDFNDSYINFNEKLNEFQKNRSSLSVDFAFIYDVESDEFDYVYEVRKNEHAVELQSFYNSALALEQSGDFKRAFDLYWMARSLPEAEDGLARCHAKFNEEAYAEMELKYQEAYALERKHDYDSAAAIYAELSGYSDSTERLANCKNRAAYLNAISFEKQGLFNEAAEIYGRLINYRDSNDRLLTCLTLAKLSSGNGYDYLAENVTKLSLLEDASSYLLGDWDIQYFADDSRSVYSCDGTTYAEIGRFKEGMYRLLADTALKTDTYAYTMQDASLQVSDRGVYQLRKISDVYYVAYSADSNGNYVIPVYLANRVIASSTGFTSLCSAEEYKALKYANITQMNLSFATKPDDTLADWYSSEESVAKLLAALLVETDDYLDFQHYGQIGETYMAVYDNSMYVIMIGMNDHTIGYYYMPEQDVLMYYIIEGMVLGSQNVSDIYSSMGCAEFKQVPSDVWFEVFESYGATEDGIIANW